MVGCCIGRITLPCYWHIGIWDFLDLKQSNNTRESFLFSSYDLAAFLEVLVIIHLDRKAKIRSMKQRLLFRWSHWQSQETFCTQVSGREYSLQIRRLSFRMWSRTWVGTGVSGPSFAARKWLKLYTGSQDRFENRITILTSNISGQIVVFKSHRMVRIPDRSQAKSVERR